MKLTLTEDITPEEIVFLYKDNYSRFWNDSLKAVDQITVEDIKTTTLYIGVKDRDKLIGVVILVPRLNKVLEGHIILDSRIKNKGEQVINQTIKYIQKKHSNFCAIMVDIPSYFPLVLKLITKCGFMFVKRVSNAVSRNQVYFDVYTFLRCI